MKELQHKPLGAATIGLLALASAMGIGRFSLTPILPLMQQDAALSLAAGGWLATANYLGYFLGALFCIALPPRPAQAIRWGLVGVGLLTLAMGFAAATPLWLILRLLAGVASAFVLVGVSALAMPVLSRHGKEHWSGHVFAGVGIGVAFAGMLGLAAALDGWQSRSAWIALGAVAMALAILLWQPLAPGAAPTVPVQQGRRMLPRRALIATICYAAFGYGYIIPATFLPALARSYIDDPAMFGAIWPVFGIAAAVSTCAGAWLGRGLTDRQLWTRAQWVLAAGVLAPALSVSVPTLLISAVCVGGTFMVITMAGIKEALRLGGTPPSFAVGAMTAAFGLGQIAGPLTISLLAGSDHAFAIASGLAVLGLAIANAALTIDGRRTARLAGGSKTCRV